MDLVASVVFLSMALGYYFTITVILKFPHTKPSLACINHAFWFFIANPKTLFSRIVLECRTFLNAYLYFLLDKL